ncbi:MAG: cell division/cell wall cluster transcriptional repressor MraZ [Burkholderiales bacterium]|nr:cell division/cell wall cluster transcriptional repressor MraZ [Burkholderiales bacterium]
MAKGLNMFGGVTHLSIDPKSRIAIPAKYRETFDIDNGFCNRITVSLESSDCLILYPEKHWLEVREKIQSLPNGSHPLVKSYQRLVLGYAETLEMDKAGRILLSSSLRDLVKLEKEAVLVGLGNRFELWDKANWLNETQKALQIPPDDLAGLLSGFSL